MWSPAWPAVRLRMNSEVVRLRTESVTGNRLFGWISMIVLALLGSWPDDPENATLYVVVCDAVGNEKERIPVRTLMGARRLRKRIRDKVATLSTDEVERWHSAQLWKSLT